MPLTTLLPQKSANETDASRVDATTNVMAAKAAIHDPCSHSRRERLTRNAATALCPLTSHSLKLAEMTAYAVMTLETTAVHAKHR